MGSANAATAKTDRAEFLKCTASCSYFIHNYCYIYDATLSEWIPFILWPEQLSVVDDLVNHKLLVILKARQLGLTWLVLCYILWRMIFHPTFTALIFSRRETEAIYLLGKERMRGIYDRLPEWAKVRQILSDSTNMWKLSNGSIAYAFPTSAGDSYTAGFAFVDEADLVPDLDKLMNAVKPTIDGGGQMVLLSRADKTTPGSRFKKIYRGAKAKLTSWKALFLPWHVRPDRNQKWYDDQYADILSATGGLDDLYQQYPATDEEALMPPTLDRRLHYSLISKCYVKMDYKDGYEYGLDIPGLKIYVPPSPFGQYVAGADPAEGNPTSDDSCGGILDTSTGEECAVFAGKIEPSVFAGYMVALAKFYNEAPILPERNNHGHAVILAVRDIHNYTLVCGPDEVPGWTQSGKGKPLMYTKMADALIAKSCIIHDETTFAQLVSIEGSTLKAPEGEHDDFATYFCLAICAMDLGVVSGSYGNNPTSGYRG